MALDGTQSRTQSVYVHGVEGGVYLDTLLYKLRRALSRIEDVIRKTRTSQV